MATDKEIVFNVTADTSGANASVSGFSENVSKSNKEVQASFNDLRARIKEATDNVNQMSRSYGENSKQADEQRKILGQLNSEYAQLAKSNTDLGASFEDVYGEMMDVNRAVGELEDRMYQLYMNGQQNTQEFKDLQAQVVEYRKAVMSVDRAVDQLAEKGKILGSALQIGSTIVAGYGVAQGAMAIFGEESEELVATLTKLQAVQTALASLEELKLQLDSQSLIMTKGRAIATATFTAVQTAYTSAMTASTVAMKALRLAMLALPIVAIIAGIAGLVAIIYDLVKSNETAQDSYDELTKAVDRQNAALDRAYAKAQRNAKNQIELAKARGASIEEIHELELKALEDEEAYRRQSVINLKDALFKKKLIYQEAMRDENYELAMKLDKEIKAERKQLQDLTDLEGQYQVDVEIKNLQHQNTINEQNKTDREKKISDYKKHREDMLRAQEEADAKELERRRLIEDLITAQIDDANVKRLAELEIQQERQREDLIKQYGEDAELLKQLELAQAVEMQAVIDGIEQEARDKKKELDDAERERILLERQREKDDQIAYAEGRLLQIEEDFYAQLELEAELAQLKMEQDLLQEDLTEGEKFRIQQEYDEKMRELSDKRVQREKENAQKIADSIAMNMEKGISAISSLTNLYFDNKKGRMEKGSKEEEAMAKKQFKVQKALMLGQAVIDGFKSITQSLAMSPIAIGPIPNPVGIASLAFAGITSAANIAKIASSKFEGGSSGGTPSATPPSVAPPTIPSVGSMFQEETGSTLTDDLLNPTQQVVVVQSDLEMANKEATQTKVISEWG